MADTKSCPGSRVLREPIPEYVNCPHCGNEVEIWTDEVKATCRKCGNRVFREMKPSCIEWCSHAKECVGPAIYERYMQGLEASPAEAGGTTRPLDLLRREHDRALDQLNVLSGATLCIRLGALAPQAVVQEKGIVNLTKVLDFFDTRLRSHFRREEEVLFPVLEKHIGKDKSPTRMMLDEHARVWELYDFLKKKAGELDTNGSPGGMPAEVQDSSRKLVRLLRDHIKKENDSLLPLARSVLSDEEMAEVGAAFQAVEARLAAST